MQRNRQGEGRRLTGTRMEQASASLLLAAGLILSSGHFDCKALAGDCLCSDAPDAVQSDLKKANA